MTTLKPRYREEMRGFFHSPRHLMNCLRLTEDHIPVRTVRRLLNGYGAHGGAANLITVLYLSWRKQKLVSGNHLYITISHQINE